MALIAGPLGHLAFPEVALALLFNFNLFFGALLSVSLGAFFIWLLRTKSKLPTETLTAIVFVVGVALGFIFLPLKKAETALVGNISTIGISDAVIAFLLSAFIFYSIKKVYKNITLADISEEITTVEGVNIKKCNFLYLLGVALAVAMEIKIIGALLPLALFVLPAATIFNLSENLNFYAYGSALLGALAFLVSFALFKWHPLPFGPVIILVNALFFAFSLFVKRK